MQPDDAERYKTRLRENRFATRLKTNIWSESPHADNPFVAESCRCHGYDLFELIEKRSFVDVLFLLFQGELPAPEQEALLRALMIGLINPGPRHPATRAAINTAIGKTDTAHILPISLLAIGGQHLGGNEVIAAMRFLNKQSRLPPGRAVETLLLNAAQPDQGDWHVAPGFGTRFGSSDPIAGKLAATLQRMSGAGRILSWSSQFVSLLRDRTGCAWLTTGVAAAALSDLGFHPRAGAGMFQLLSAPGLLAHGLEMSNKPITAMPFIDDEHYVFEQD